MYLRYQTLTNKTTTFPFIHNKFLTYIFSTSATSKRASDDTEQKKEKQRASATQREKVRELSLMKPEVFILEGEKEKVRISVGIEKEIIKQTPSRSGSKSSTSRSVKSAARPSSIAPKVEEQSFDKSKSILEEQSETVMKSGDPELVSPPQKVAQMINLLQEIKGAKVSTDATEFPICEDKDKKDEEVTREIEISEVEETVDEASREEMKKEYTEEEEDKGKTEEFKSNLKEETSADEPVAERESGGSKKLSAERVKEKSIDSDVTISSAEESVSFELKKKRSSSRKSSGRRREISVETSSSHKPDAETQA